VTRILHLLKGDDVELLSSVLAQPHGAGDEITLVRLPGAATFTPPDNVTVLRVPEDLSYDALLDRIFEADQVVTW
jgi:hypothetical protein